VPDFEDCLRQLMTIRGALGASLIDHVSGLTVASAGQAFVTGQDFAHLGPMGVVRSILNGPAFAPPARPGYVEDVVITAANGYHLLHLLPVAYDSRLVLYVWLDRMLGNLAMTQRSLHAVGRELLPA
jgi:hypothetical protein